LSVRLAAAQANRHVQLHTATKGFEAQQQVQQAVSYTASVEVLVTLC